MALPLRRQIIILNAAILVPVFVVMVWSARETYLESTRYLQAEAQSIASTIVVYLERGMDIPAMQGVIETIPLPAGTVITITDNRSVVLARSREAERFVGRPIEGAGAAAAIQDVPEVVIREGLDGVERAFANVPYSAGPWLVSVGIPTQVARDRIWPIFRRNVAVAIVATVFTLLLEFLLARRYIRAFNQAVETSRRVASGDLTPLQPEPMPSLEMEHLQTSFIDIVKKLRDAREAVSAQVAEERRIREELESLQRQVIRQERLAAIGVLVSGVAHELNNPLQAILGFAELLQLRKDLPPQIQSDLELIQKESTRASGIIRNLSRFGRQQGSEPTACRLRDVVASVVELRHRKLEESNIVFDVDDRAELPVMAIFTELQQVVLNFVINAEQAVMHGMTPRRIIIRTSDIGQRARLEVQDSGPGVPRDHEAKLFQPFFTTKAVGEGTGLGLSVSYGIIQSHGGTIGYRAAPGGGALFWFELPAMYVTARSSTSRPS